MTAVYLDTVGIIALLNRSDQWHAAASAAMEGLPPGVALMTSEYVLLEAANGVARTRLRENVVDLRETLAASGRLVIPTSQEIESAWTTYRRGVPGGPSIVDCVSYEVMRRLGLTRALSNDVHFAAAGFTNLF